MLSVTPISPPNGLKEERQQLSKDLPVTLPAILGRGPLLKCSNVKVSRRHASLDWADEDDDGVAIEALFSQPTFVEVAGVRAKLQSGERATLKHGDAFGLLPSAAWYRINLPGTAQQQENASEASEASNSTPRDSGVEMECGTDCSSARSSDQVLQRESHATDDITRPSASETPSADNGSREPKLSCAETDAAKLTSPCAADESDSSAAPPLAAQKESVTVEESKSCTGTTVVEDIEGKIKEGPVPSDAAHTVVSTTPTATSSRVRTLPAWMTREPAAAASSPPKQQSPASTGRRKNTTRRKPRVKVAPAKRSVDQMSSSENEDDKALNSPAKDKETVSPNRFRNTKAEVSSKRALHQLSESDEEDSSIVETAKAAPVVSRAKIAAPTSAEKVRHASSDNSDGPSANPTATSTSFDIQNDNSDLDSRAARADQSRPGASSAADEEQQQSALPDPRRMARNGTQSTNASSAAPSSAKRKSCTYGASCYRRNPQHKRDEAHPGDPDYASGGESDGDSDDERPHCEYGVDCYRKNPEHRRQYKHTRIPQPQRLAKRKRAAKGLAGQRSDSDTPDEFDLEFLNDASSDDYAPSDSGDSDSERFPSQPLDEEEKSQLKRLGKEAKKFIKRGR